MKKAIPLTGIVVLMLSGLLWFFVSRVKKGTKEKNEPPVPGILTEGFIRGELNQSAEKLMAAYYKMTEGFVNWDTGSVILSGKLLKLAMDSFKTDNLKADTVLYQKMTGLKVNAGAELESIISDPSLDEKRGSLNILSQYIKDLLLLTHYTGAKLYWQKCPMAFGDKKPGNWLSPTDVVRNPYLGKYHPSFGDRMLDCGGVADSVDFIGKKTTQK